VCLPPRYRRRSPADPAPPAIGLLVIVERNLVGIRQEDERVARPNEVFGASSFAQIHLSSIALTQIGQALYDLLGLATVPGDDQDGVMAALRGENPPVPGNPAAT
jgi:hypothetical protein